MEGLISLALTRRDIRAMKTSSAPSSQFKLAAFFSLLVSCLLIDPTAEAGQGFLASISPARLELKSEPGKVVRGALTIENMGREPANYLVRSSEWDYTEAGQSLFSDNLKNQSCRPWLRLERRKISVQPRAKRNFRYEFHVPAGTPAQECRLAVLIEGEDLGGVAQAGGGLALPVKGRMAVIIYLSVGNVKPALSFTGPVASGGSALRFANSGNATGRVVGLMRGKDAANNDFDVSVSKQPILPGQRRSLALAFSQPGTRKTATPTYPVTVSGDLFWQYGTIPVKTVLQQ